MDRIDRMRRAFKESIDGPLCVESLMVWVA